jgi:hypothetical protein
MAHGSWLMGGGPAPTRRHALPIGLLLGNLENAHAMRMLFGRGRRQSLTQRAAPVSIPVGWEEGGRVQG